MDYAGCEIQTTLDVALYENPAATCIDTPPGDLNCKAIFFVKWSPNADEASLAASTTDVLLLIFRHMIQYNFTTVAFPTIGFEHFTCPMKLFVKTLVQQAKLELIRIDRPFTIKFAVEPNQTEIYNEICKQILTADAPGASQRRSREEQCFSSSSSLS